jgi:glycosyltransferase involved in cell wall biosynthesis
VTDARDVRILYLSDIRFPLERANGMQTIATARALAARGADVTLLVRPDTASPPRDPFAFYGLAPEPALHVRRVPVRGGPAARRAIYVAAAILTAAQREADLVFTRDLGVASMLLRVGRRRPPLVYESHGLAAVVGAALGELLSTGRAASPRKQRRLARREARVWREADGYVTITATLAQDLERDFGRRDRLAIVPDGVHLEPSRTFTPPRATAAPLVVYAGHLYPWKGVDTFVRAMALLAGARALVVGGHPAEADLARLQRLSSALGLEGRVTFTGPVAPADVAGRLTVADVLVLPNSGATISARYTSPLKLFEYLAAGRPIVASALPALEEVLRDGGNALLVPPDDPAALAAAIVRVASDERLACRIARAAFDEALFYTWDARAARLEALFADVLRARRQG